MTHPTTASLDRSPAPAPVPAPEEVVAEPLLLHEPAVVAGEQFPSEPAAETWAGAGARLIRFRVRADHHGLRLRAGESVLCVPYEPAELGMVVLVRCESDGHAPGALLSVRELDYVAEAGQYAGDGDWDEPGTRAWPVPERSWRPGWMTRLRR